MPRTKIVLYREDDGTVPLLAWLDSIPDKARDKCFVRIERLRELGHELRVALQGINYRMLYFFHRREAVVLSHGLVKEREVPSKEIDRAIARKLKYEAAPSRHTHEEIPL